MCVRVSSFLISVDRRNMFVQVLAVTSRTSRKVRTGYESHVFSYSVPDARFLRNVVLIPARFARRSSLIAEFIRKDAEEEEFVEDDNEDDKDDDDDAEEAMVLLSEGEESGASESSDEAEFDDDVVAKPKSPKTKAEKSDPVTVKVRAPSMPSSNRGDWMFPIHNLKTMSTNSGGPIKKCVMEAIKLLQKEMDASEYFDEETREKYRSMIRKLRKSVSDKIYKSNASGPTKNMALEQEPRRWVVGMDGVMACCRGCRSDDDADNGQADDDGDDADAAG